MYLNDLNCITYQEVDMKKGSSNPLVFVAQVMFAVFCLPFVIMRAAMMELDCFITHKKELVTISVHFMTIDRFLLFHGTLSRETIRF